MTTRKLDKKQWRTFFDRVSTTLEAKEAEIEIASLRLGDQAKRSGCLCSALPTIPTMTSSRWPLEGLDHLIPKRATSMWRIHPADWWRSKSSMRTTSSKSSSFAIR